MTCAELLDEKIKNSKEEFILDIFEKVDKGELTKLEAIKLLDENDLLGVSRFYNYPHFMEKYFSNVERYGTQKFYEILSFPDRFMKKDGSTNPYASFPDTTQEEAIDETYDFIKENEIIGCVMDW